MITNYANRQYQSRDVVVTRAWRHGIKNGDTVTLSEPEAARVIKLGCAVPVETAQKKPPARKKRASGKDD